MIETQHNFPVRVYYEDTDHAGIVYYANYLKFMERGRTEFLRSEHIELDDVEQQHGVVFAVTQANIRYHAPARFNDMLEVQTTLKQARGARLLFQQQVWRRSTQAQDTLLVKADIHLACMDKAGKARRIPASVFPFTQLPPSQPPSTQK